MENYGVGWMSSFPENQKGVALLTAMLVVTLGTVIAVNMMWNASLDLRRTTAALAADQGLLYLQGAEAWAGDILRTDLIASGESDNLGDSGQPHYLLCQLMAE
jgi:general secretion pathway protein K